MIHICACVQKFVLYGKRDLLPLAYLIDEAMRGFMEGTQFWQMSTPSFDFATKKFKND